ncbi:hypothetical protein VNO78_09540 [Psophocarpus tetragonolobus]|uniref:Uncharacterized protein n=1 Tax=Psophocarpus tetragonolobus TaxID=3891 RepID=A0AAN9XTB2_PSOTE
MESLMQHASASPAHTKIMLQSQRKSRSCKNAPSGRTYLTHKIPPASNTKNMIKNDTNDMWQVNLREHPILICDHSVDNEAMTLSHDDDTKQVKPKEMSHITKNHRFEKVTDHEPMDVEHREQ